MSPGTNQQEFIDQIEQFPGTLDAAVHHLSSEQLDTPYREGGWTVRQVVHHIADAGVNGYIRIKLALTEENPTLKPYDQDHWAALHEARTGELGPSLMIMRGIHQRLAETLREIDPADFARTAFHPEQGQVTVESYAKHIAWHCDHHLEQIEGLVSARGW